MAHVLERGRRTSSHPRDHLARRVRAVLRADGRPPRTIGRSSGSKRAKHDRGAAWTRGGPREHSAPHRGVRPALGAAHGLAQTSPAHGDHASSGEWAGPTRPQPPACEAVSSYAITQLRHALLLGAMGATEDPAIRLYAMADDPA